MPKAKTITEVVPAKLGRSFRTLSGTFSRRNILIAATVILLVALGILKKEWFVVAMVNGQPITRLSLEQSLVKQYGSQTLDGLVSQAIVEQAVGKEKTEVTEKMVDQKLAEIAASLPTGMTLDQALQTQGVDKIEFRKRIRMQLAIEKALSSKVSISEKDITDYISSNSAQFKSASPSAARESARKAVEQQKLNDAFLSWFSDLKQKAKILRFL